MQITASSKSVRISPRKIQLVADSVRRKPLDKALALLAVTHKRAAEVLAKTIKSAAANAVHNAKVAKDNLMIERIEVAPGPVFKRFRPSTRGRGHPYKKRTTHIKVILEEGKGEKGKG